MSNTIAPLPGFDWTLVNWGGPDEPRTEHCSYCGDELSEYDVPLILWNAEGWCAEFCDHCQATWWGMQSFDEVDEPQHEPEVVAREATCQQGAPCGDPDNCPDPVGCGFQPGYWMYETSGVLRPAVEAFVRGEPMPPAYIATMRSYLRQWIMAPVWQGEGIEQLRTEIDGLTSREAIARWINTAAEEGLDPL